jgi:hypothetical protein
MLECNNKIIACDIDNTVADQLSFYRTMFDSSLGRVPLDACGNINLMRYNVLEDSVYAITEFAKHYKICWISARKEENRSVTNAWLEKNKFPMDYLYLVCQNDNKLKILNEIKPALYIDDMKYNYERLDPLPCTNFIKSLAENGIKYEVFKNNWKAILINYLNKEY